jgi:hypothetical protein
MRKTKLLIALNLLVQIAQASILPENSLAFPVSAKNEGLTESQYHQVIDKVEKVYRPIVEELGKKLTISRLWDDPRVNAGTLRSGREWILRMYGGYARHPLVTEDGYALVMCHELGHHLGGSPKKYLGGNEPRWPSTEGQADYFATLKCLRRIFRHENNKEIVAKLPVPTFVSEQCALPFPNDWERALCIRTAMAGISVANISATIRNTEFPRPETPDADVVGKTFEAHPKPQCRLDTYFQGSICEVSSIRSVSDTDEVAGTCHPKAGHTSGTRPLCWFKPEE